MQEYHSARAVDRIAARGLRPQNANFHDERLMWTMPRNCVRLDTGDAWSMPRVLVVRLDVGDEEKKKNWRKVGAHVLWRRVTDVCRRHRKRCCLMIRCIIVSVCACMIYAH